MAEYICSKCHYVGKPRLKKRGSLKTEAMMWAVFPLGIPYTIWRMFGKTRICRECSSDFLVDAECPLGLRLIAASEDEILNKIAGAKSSTRATQTLVPSLPSLPEIVTTDSKPLEFEKLESIEAAQAAAMLPHAAEVQKAEPQAMHTTETKSEQKNQLHQDPNVW